MTVIKKNIYILFIYLEFIYNLPQFHVRDISIVNVYELVANDILHLSEFLL